jgi:hypothetical protein
MGEFRFVVDTIDFSPILRQGSEGNDVVEIDL